MKLSLNNALYRGRVTVYMKDPVTIGKCDWEKLRGSIYAHTRKTINMVIDCELYGQDVITIDRATIDRIEP